jgi:hypothetical protein
MLPTNPNRPGVSERRAGERHAPKSNLVCQVIDLKDESAASAGMWDVSQGGLCVIVEPQYAPGAHVEIALHAPASGASLHRFAKVVHTLLIPSLREMWMTGCSFGSDPMSEDELRPYL